jgi:hypothetical protein
MIILVSSRNNIGFANFFTDNGKSFMKIRNNNGTNIEPCGTPCLTGSHFEDTLSLISFIDTL